MDKGAHFHRCDFQVHTPRDINWTGAHYTSDEDRGEYAARLIQACRDKGLDAIGVTDHHDLCFVNFIRNAAAAEVDGEGLPLPKEKRLVVYPGIELTLTVPCQAIVLFDADLPEDLFSLALTALAITPSDPTEPKTAPVERLEQITTLDGLYAELDKYEYLRRRYIILPNVSEGGKDTLLRSGAGPKYKAMPCVGGYVDGSVDQLGKGNRKIVGGGAKEYGHKRIAVFQTSDSRREDHKELGRVSTWVKWATPTAEALRQACLAQESRVSQTPPRLPSVSIDEISLSNSGFLGPFDLTLNPQYNALIGGRGTGKSTILEYLRWALCDQPPPGLEDAYTPNYMARRGLLIDQTLRPLNATVELRFQVNGVPHTLRRASGTGELLMKIGGGDLEACSEEDVRRLLPIQAYSQKQLSDVSVRAEELLRFVTSPIRPRLESIQQRLSDKAGRIKETHVAVRRRRALNRLITERQLSEVSLAQQADTLRAGLTGLSDEDRVLLDKGKTYSDADHAVSSWRDGVAALRDSAESLHRTLRRALAEAAAPPAEPEPEILGEAFEEYRELLSEAQDSLAALVEKADALTSPTETQDEQSPWRRWAEKSRAFRHAYDAAVQRSSAHSQELEKLQTIEEQHQKHVRETSRLREELRALGTVDEENRAERDDWEALLEEHDLALNEQCLKLTSDSEGAIRAGVQRYADAAEFVEGLKRAVSGSRVPKNKLEALGKSISDSETAAAASSLWKEILADLEQLAEFDEERDGADKRPTTPALSKVGLTASNLGGVARTLTPDEWLTLSLTPIKSAPVFEYQAREQEYIPFQNASAGQQATALLKTLLNQPGPPLIIDQPEEDLDNPVMLEIVERVWNAKQQRQLIFASHNANLVVNGDAELVAWCDHRTAGDQSRGTIAGEGAIDVEDVRDAVKRIMEGGEAAFNLRKQKGIISLSYIPQVANGAPLPSPCRLSHRASRSEH